MEAPELRPSWVDFVKANPLPPPSTSIPEYRKIKQAREAHAQDLLVADPTFAVLRENVVVEERTISLPEVAGHEFNLRIYRPSSNRENQGSKLPVLLYFHGGYWCSGSSLSEDLGCRAIIARGNDIVIVSFEYRLVPEARWHTVFGDAEWAMKWVSVNAASLGGAIEKGFLVGGAEAGAHLAAIGAVRARKKYQNTIKLTGQVLIVPTTLAFSFEDKRLDRWRGALGSHLQNRLAPVLDEAMYQMFVKALGIPEAEKGNEENFPVWAPYDVRKDLPPAYLPMDECDPIRDQGFLYAELLQEAGVKTRTDFYRGLPNMFVQWPELEETVIAGGHLAAGVAWLLQERK